MPTILFAAPSLWPEYQTALPQALAEVGVTGPVVTEARPEDVDYIVYAPSSPLQDFTADTRTSSAARVIAENIRRGEAGEPFLHLVDRARGY